VDFHHQVIAHAGRTTKGLFRFFETALFSLTISEFRGRNLLIAIN
jgi:hypothetical protein